MDIKSIREVTNNYTKQEIDECIDKISNEDSCDININFDDLCKSSFIKEEMDKGIDQKDAIRELARRTRQFS